MMIWIRNESYGFYGFEIEKAKRNGRRHVEHLVQFGESRTLDATNVELEEE